MKIHGLLAALAVTAAVVGQGPSAARNPASSTPPGTTPFPQSEVLNYSVNWPTGLSLGEAQLKANGGDAGWQFEFSLEANLPILEVRDRYRSSATAQFCSERLEKEFAHGPRKGKETVTYDQQKHTAVRQTVNGGKSEISIPDCVKDGLTFLYLLRRELANGRIPGSQPVNFGAAYQVTATYTDSPMIEVGGNRQQADRVQVSFRGPASNRTIEIFFGRDPARTPLLIRTPFTLGTFALELVR